MVKVIITGTNGKGSTATYLSNLLAGNNLSVGLFTSPHYTTFNERIRVNQQLISDDDLYIIISEVMNFEHLINYKFSFFEITTIVSLIYFSRKKANAIIMEVGIGGLYDCTNLISYDFAIITQVASDHLDVIGPTIKDVLYNKLGIVKPNMTLITHSHIFPKEVKSYCRKMGAKFILANLNKIKQLPNNYFKYLNYRFKLQLNYLPQAANALLALICASCIFNKHFNYKDPLFNTFLPGRTEIIGNIILDGAHNLSAINYLSNYLKANLIKINTCYYSVLKGKDIKGITTKLLDITKHLVFVIFPDNRCYSLEELSLPPKVEIIQSNKFMQQLETNKQDKNHTLITGSIHFVGYVKHLLNRSNNN